MQQLHEPQEIEVWYVLPTIRSQITKELKKLGLTSIKISEILGLSKAAVSQYLNDKRAKNIDFPKVILDKIVVIADIIKDDPSKMTFEVQNLLKEIRNSKLLCKYHKIHSKIDEKCTVCID